MLGNIIIVEGHVDRKANISEQAVGGFMVKGRRSVAWESSPVRN